MGMLVDQCFTLAQTGKQPVRVANRGRSAYLFPSRGAGDSQPGSVLSLFNASAGDWEEEEGRLLGSPNLNWAPHKTPETPYMTFF